MDILFAGTDLRRRMVTSDQIDGLLEFMKEHPELAKGLSRGRRGKLMTVKVWNSCALRLNFMKQGAIKDGKGWSKYWCDWKYRVRRHALELKAAKESNTPAPDGLTPLSSIEETIMGIIGEESLNSVEIKTDPLAEEESGEEVPGTESNKHGDNEEPTKEIDSRQGNPKRKASSREFSDGDKDDSSPKGKKARREEASDEDDGLSMEFLRLEREKLDLLRNINNSYGNMLTQMTRVAEAVDRIQSYLMS